MISQVRRRAASPNPSRRSRHRLVRVRRRRISPGSTSRCPAPMVRCTTSAPSAPCSPPSTATGRSTRTGSSPNATPVSARRPCSYRASQVTRPSTPGTRHRMDRRGGRAAPRPSRRRPHCPPADRRAARRRTAGVDTQGRSACHRRPAGHDIVERRAVTRQRRGRRTDLVRRCDQRDLHGATCPVSQPPEPAPPPSSTVTRHVTWRRRAARAAFRCRHAAPR